MVNFFPELNLPMAWLPHQSWDRDSFYPILLLGLGLVLAFCVSIVYSPAWVLGALGETEWPLLVVVVVKE